MGYHFKLGDVIKNARHWIFGILDDTLADEVVHAYTFCVETNETWIECEIPPFTPYWIGLLGNIGAARIRTIKEV